MTGAWCANCVDYAMERAAIVEVDGTWVHAVGGSTWCPGQDAITRTREATPAAPGHPGVTAADCPLPDPHRGPHLWGRPHPDPAIGRVSLVCPGMLPDGTHRDARGPR